MSTPSRPASCWSSSMSTQTKSRAFTRQTSPLITAQRKLFQQKNLSQHMTKSKHNMEELFQLYYSTDIKFDTFQRQIVTGTRISTAKTAPIPQTNLANISTNTSDSKHSVTREQLKTMDLSNEQQPINNETQTKESIPDRIVKKSTINLAVPSSQPSLSTRTVFVAVPNLLETTPSVEQDEFCDLSLVKSVTFIEDDFDESHENINTKKRNSNTAQRPISSSSTISPGPAPPPSLMIMNDTNRKDTSVSSHTSTQQQQQPNRTAIVTGSSVVVRQRSPTKQSSSRQRAHSTMTMTTNLLSQRSTPKTRASSTHSPLSVEPDMAKIPVYVNAQRIVSIPSKCSRYVLVTFPAVPLRYNSPSYVERLLLPERFPTLFQNIVQNHDHHHRK